MAKQKLFTYAVLHHEKVDKGNSKEDITTTVVIEPKTVLAADDKVVLLQVAKAIPEKYSDKLQDLEILIKPF